MQERARRYTVAKRQDHQEGPYYLHWAENGRQRRRSTGLYDERLAKALSDRLNAEESERAIFGRAVIEDNVTFAYAAHAYCQAAETEAEKAARERFITRPIERLGDLPVRAIDDDVMRVESRKAYPLAKPATRRRQFYGPTCAVLSWSARKPRRWCDAPDFDKPEDSKARDEWVMPDIAEKIIASLDPSPRARAAFEIGFGAGLRASEAALLDWGDVYLSAGQIRVRGTKTSAADRMVDIPPRCVSVLANLPWKEGPVCRTPKGAAYIVRGDSGGLFNDALTRACRRAGVKRITFHVLRHSWATWRADADPNLVRLMALGGWSSLKIVQRYAKNAPRGTGARAAELGWDFAATTPPATKEERKTA